MKKSYFSESQIIFRFAKTVATTQPLIAVPEKVQAIYTPKRVVIFCKGTSTAVRQRDQTFYGYTIVKEHLPEHQCY